MVDRQSFALGLVGAGIGATLTPAMQEREGRAAGLSLTYRIIDAEVEGFGVDAAWTASTSPTRSSRR